jgi:glycine/D-amino acid oxidase-like deaminating enzyme
MDLLIVGGGVFGVSTALVAVAQYRQVTLIDDQDQHYAASRGHGRIYRTRYPRHDYEELALAAGPGWHTDRFKKYFHTHTRVVHDKDGTITEDHDSAWIEAARVMEDGFRLAAERGVKIVTDTASSLLWDGDRCIGVATVNHGQWLANVILLTLGASLPMFLRSQSRPIDDICESVMVPWMCVQLNDEQYLEKTKKPFLVKVGKGNEGFYQISQD